MELELFEAHKQTNKQTTGPVIMDYATLQHIGNVK